jgi:hypothetical protein
LIFKKIEAIKPCILDVCNCCCVYGLPWEQMDEKKSQVIPILMANIARLEYFEIINYLNLYC